MRSDELSFVVNLSDDRFFFVKFVHFNSETGI